MIGTTLGPYRVVDKLGAGGMGEVYRARDTRLHRDVAVKVLSASSDAPGARERFESEARAIAALQHPNICTIFDVGVMPDGQPYLVMELLQGGTLQQRISGGAMPLPEVLDAAVGLADALDAAHRAGIVHRDIKPGNIVITARGPKMLDFGLAKTAMDRPSPFATEATVTALSPLTAPGAVVGTLAYMSPEQLRAEPLDARTDLFSLGVVLYEMVTGRAPFAGSTAAVVSAAILGSPPPDPRELRTDVPPRLAEILFKALEKDRDLRYQHAAEMRADLQRVTRDLGATDWTVASPPREPAIRSAWRRRGLTVLAAAVVLSCAAGLIWYSFWGARADAAKLTERDTIVLGGFTNSTGDPMFDETLRAGLAVQLGQSAFLRLLPEATIAKTLALMGQPATVPLTGQIARDLCLRSGSAAVLEGSIAPLGSEYVIGLRATDCVTGDLLAQEQIQAARKEDVLRAIGEVGDRFRTRIGESLATIETNSVPLVEATTGSMEAWNEYVRARPLTFTKGFAESEAAYKRAIEIDPQFAVAYAQLGLGYSVQGESERAAAAITKAYELRERTSAGERFFITYMYDRNVTGNLPRAQETLRAWAEAYPRNADPLGLLGGFVSQGVGDYELTRKSSLQALEVDPDLTPAYLNLASIHMYAGQLEEAQQAIREVEQRGAAGIFDVVRVRFSLAFLRDDPTTMQRELSEGGRTSQDRLLGIQSLVLARTGRLREAQRASSRAIDLAAATGRHERAALYLAGTAVQHALFARFDDARRLAMEALRQPPVGRDLGYAAGIALALAGDASRAESIAVDMQARFPEDTCVRSTYVPTLRAVVALKAGDPGRALALLEANEPYELGLPSLPFNLSFGALYSVYVRGEAYLAAGRPADAIRELDKFRTYRGIVVFDPIAAAARLQLGRAHVAAGNVVAARREYDDVLTLWTDADADLPLVQEARAEAKRLVSGAQ